MAFGLDVRIYRRQRASDCVAPPSRSNICNDFSEARRDQTPHRPATREARMSRPQCRLKGGTRKCTIHDLEGWSGTDVSSRTSLRPRTFSSFIFAHFRPISLNRLRRSWSAQVVPSETALVRRMSTAISHRTGRAWTLRHRDFRSLLERACSSAVCHRGGIKCCFLLTSEDALMFSTVAMWLS